MYVRSWEMENMEGGAGLMRRLESTHNTGQPPPTHGPHAHATVRPRARQRETGAITTPRRTRQRSLSALACSESASLRSALALPSAALTAAAACFLASATAESAFFVAAASDFSPAAAASARSLFAT